MGCGLSTKRFIPNSMIEGQDENALEIISMLGFSPSDVDLLYTAFWDIDADESGLIKPEELFSYFEVEGTPFEKRLFALFDEDGSGVINFLEFVCSVWNILTLPQEDFGSVAYLLRDPTAKLNIRFSDVRIILEMLHNKKIDKDPALLSVFNQMKRDLETKLSIYEFNKWTAANPSVTAPILMLQLHLRLQIIGESFWVKLTNLRREDAEKGRLDYVKQLQKYTIEKNRRFREIAQAVEKERQRLERLEKGGREFEAEENIARKESILLGFFNLKKKKLSRVAVYKKDINDADDDEKNERDTKSTTEEREREYSLDNLISNNIPINFHEASNTAFVRVRGASADSVEGNNSIGSSSNEKSKRKPNLNKPIIYKYEENNNNTNSNSSSNHNANGSSKASFESATAVNSTHSNKTPHSTPEHKTKKQLPSHNNNNLGNGRNNISSPPIQEQQELDQSRDLDIEDKELESIDNSYHKSQHQQHLRPNPPTTGSQKSSFDRISTSKKQMKSEKKSTHSQKRKQSLKAYQEVVNADHRKTSIFDIFEVHTKKLNYDILDENENENENMEQGKEKEKKKVQNKKKPVEIRKRRSVLKKPNLLRKDEKQAQRE